MTAPARIDLAPDRAPLAGAGRFDLGEAGELAALLAHVADLIPEIVAKRIDQVTRHGHTAARDDAAPADALAKVAYAYAGDALDLSGGEDPARIARCRMKHINAIAAGFAAVARIDRAVAQSIALGEEEERKSA
ncbi:hypothetical protein FSZ31_04210 [Sphingorhabdus soli]|uniref:Uncharacterized protein n=1 Tax=Flavisphingopyxis soli TaxID=2601267 RepID=A0A5C6UP60_9SPHN|nr:hypothetical protein [Sphingorhabdus soli]TXC73931.1 hypothetical protein FSZ31_04210 [Sphingorhabdus soli]